LVSTKCRGYIILPILTTASRVIVDAESTGNSSMTVTTVLLLIPVANRMPSVQ